MAAALLTVSTNCATGVNYIPTNSGIAPKPGRRPDSVEVFLTQNVPRTYYEIGILEAARDGSATGMNMSDTVSSMRQRAAEVGCDGIIFVDYGVKDKLGGARSSTASVTSTHAACVMYTKPAPSNASPSEGDAGAS